MKFAPVPIRLPNSVYPDGQNSIPDEELRTLFNAAIRPLRNAMRETTRLVSEGDYVSAAVISGSWLVSGYLHDFDPRQPTEEMDRLAASAVARFLAHISVMTEFGLRLSDVAARAQASLQVMLDQWLNVKRAAGSGYYKGNHALFAAIALDRPPWMMVAPDGIAISEVRGASTWRYHVLSAGLLTLLCKRHPNLIGYYRPLFNLVLAGRDNNALFQICAGVDQLPVEGFFWWFLPALRDLGIYTEIDSANRYHSWFGEY